MTIKGTRGSQREEASVESVNDYGGEPLFAGARYIRRRAESQTAAVCQFACELPPRPRGVANDTDSIINPCDKSQSGNELRPFISCAAAVYKTNTSQLKSEWNNSLVVCEMNLDLYPAYLPQI